MSAEEKTRIVMSILAGELSGRRAARRAKVSEQSVGFWKRRQFLEAGKAGLTATGRCGPRPVSSNSRPRSPI